MWYLEMERGWEQKKTKVVKRRLDLLDLGRLCLSCVATPVREGWINLKGLLAFPPEEGSASSATVLDQQSNRKLKITPTLQDTYLRRKIAVKRSSRAIPETPLACYRTGFGPPARKRKKSEKGFCLSQTTEKRPKIGE